MLYEKEQLNKVTEDISELKKEPDLMPEKKHLNIASSMLKLNTNQLQHVATDSLDSLALLSDQLKDRIKLVMETLQFPTEEDEDSDILQQKYRNIKELLGRTEHGMYKAQFCNIIAQYLRQIELERVTTREKWRKLRSENGETKSKIFQMETDFFSKECRLVDMQKEKDHWRFLCSLPPGKNHRELCTDEEDLWNRVLLGKDVNDAILNFANHDIVQRYSKAIKMLYAFEIEEAANYILAWNTDSSSNSDIAKCYKSNILVTIAFTFTNENKFKEALEMVMEALNIRKTLHGESHRLVAAYNNIIAFIYWKMKDYKIAAQYTYKGLRCMENIFKDTVKSSELADYYLTAGGMLQRFSYHQEGLRLVELGAIIFNSLLPKEDSRWLKGMARLSRTCNDVGAVDDAMQVCYQVITYFHKKRKKISKIHSSISIFDMAIKQQKQNNPKENLPIQKLKKLSPDMATIFRELSLVFIFKQMFIAARVIEECLNNNEIDSSKISAGVISSDEVFSTINRARSLLNKRRKRGKKHEGIISFNSKDRCPSNAERRGDHSEELLQDGTAEQNSDSLIWDAGDGGSTSCKSTGADTGTSSLKAILRQPILSANRLSKALKKTTTFGSKKFNEWFHPNS